jgi:outer membrane protein
MSKLKNLFVVCFMVFGSLGQMHAQGIKLAYLSTDELLLALPEVKAANDSLMVSKQKLETKIQKMVQELRSKAGALEKRKQEIAPIQYQKEVELLQAEEKKIQEFEQLGQQELKLKSESFSGPLEAKVNLAIKEVAAAEGFTYVINSSQGLVLYADASVNILEKVKAKLLIKK